MLKFNYSTSLSTSILNILCFILVLINLSAQSQEKTNYPFEIVEDAEVIVITNRILDYSDGKYNISSNIDTTGPLTYYYSKHIGDYQISLQNLDQGQLHTVIKEKGGNWLLFVHGDYKTLELAVLRAMDISETYDINVMVFSWPSQDEDLKGTRNFKNSKANVFRSEGDFIELIELFKDLDENQILNSDSISAFFHSLGNLYLKNFAENVTSQKRVFANLIMNSAAVEQEDHERWVDNLNIQERIFIIYNKRDFTLNGLRIFTPAGKQLGERVTGTLSEKATYLDFSEIVGHEFPTWNSHSFYIGEMPKEHPVIKDIYWQLFRGKNLDIDNNWQLERSELQNRIIIKESSKR